MVLALLGCGTEPTDLPVLVPPVVTTTPPPSPPVNTDAVLAPPVLVGAPTNPTITSGDRKVLLRWDPVSGATAYRIERNTLPESLTVDPKVQPFTHGETSPLANQILYGYVLTSGAQSTTLFGIPIAADNAAPRALTLTTDGAATTLSWTAPVSGANGYRIYWSNRPGVSPANGTRIEVNDTSYVHAGLKAGRPYHYIVIAVSSSGSEGPASAAVGAVSGGDVRATITPGDGRITLDWPPTVVPLAIESFTSLSLFLQAPVFFPVTLGGLENGVMNRFKIFPIYPGGEGPPSTFVFATPSPASTVIPQNVTVTGGNGRNTLTWSAVSGAIGYTVKVTDPAGNRAPDVTILSYRDAGLANATICVDTACPRYTYSVSAVFADGSGGPESASVGATPSALNAFVPILTNQENLVLTGLKTPEAGIVLNGVDEIIRADELTWWRTIIPLQDGVNEFRLTANDGVRQSAPSLHLVTLDRERPSKPDISSSSCVPSSTAFTVTISGTKDSDAAVMQRKSDGDAIVVGSNGNEAWTATLEGYSGTGDLIFYAKDAAGNSSELPDVTVPPPCPS